MYNFDIALYLIFLTTIQYAMLFFSRGFRWSFDLIQSDLLKCDIHCLLSIVVVFFCLTCQNYITEFEVIYIGHIRKLISKHTLWCNWFQGIFFNPLDLKLLHIFNIFMGNLKLGAKQHLLGQHMHKAAQYRLQSLLWIIGELNLI